MQALVDEGIAVFLTGVGPYMWFMVVDCCGLFKVSSRTFKSSI
jgi:hypothetical protein